MATFQEFAKQFKTLSKTDQNILKVLTILFEPINQTNTAKLLRSCGVKTEKGTYFYPKEIKDLRKELMAKGWLVEDWKSQLELNPEYAEYIMRLASIDTSFNLWLEVIRKYKPYNSYSFYSSNSYEVCQRELRIAIHTGNLALFNQVSAELNRHHRQKWDIMEFVQQVFLPFDAKWFATYAPEIQEEFLSFLVSWKMMEFEPIDEFVDYLENSEFTQQKNNFGSSFRANLNMLYALQGKVDKMTELLPLENDELSQLQRIGWVKFLLGNYAEANLTFEKAVKLLRKIKGNRKELLINIAGPFHVLSILALKEKNYLKKVKDYYQQVGNTSPVSLIFNYFRGVAFFQQNQAEEMHQIMNSAPQDGFDHLFWAISAYWNQLQPTPRLLEKLETYCQKAKENGYSWIAMEFSAILTHFSHAPALSKRYEKDARALEKKLGVKSMLPIVPIIEKWERSLEALLKLKTKGKRGSNRSSEKSARLVWLINFEREHLQPKEQTLNKSGKWSKGRNVALKRLKDGGVTSATEHDLRLNKAIKMYSYGYYGQKDYEINFSEAMRILVGHPFLFRMDSPSVSVELIAKEPELVVEEKDGKFIIKFEEKFAHTGSFLIKETPTRYAVLTVNETHQQINQLLDGGALKVPASAKKRVVEAIGNISSAVTVHSAVGEKAKDIPTVKADSRIYVHMLPLGDGFKLEFFVKPFKSDAPYFKPGSGRAHIIADIKGTRKQTKRNLATEKKNADIIENACPTFRKSDGYNQEWKFDEIEDCLNILLELEPLKKDKKIVLEHPKGEKLKLVGQADFNSLSMSIKKERDWFGMDGKLNINGKKVLDFRQLLAAVENSDMPFVQLSDGEFLGLTRDLQKQLKEINSLIHKNKNSLQFHPLTSPVLEEFTDLLEDIKVDAAWKKQVRKMSEARTVNPKVPSTFKAELRDYQQEGFRWLAQLAHWEVGACLADDMGLGKTIQGLAVLLNRAKEGPALVVAPASVARNWLREAQKFAPTLNAILFGGGDRKEVVDNLKPFDLLICSYGLMQTEEELLASQTFNTIILDEAQAIKNRSTKRSKAAMNLQGNFKILTTGTPIENHLGELWNLFNFLNPGLLGSMSFFNENYAIPIEKNNDKDKRKQLKRLIQPFILRRRKNDVLHELPAKTEITLTVELSEEERAFYEALRQTAVENIEGLGEESNSRFQILAELMKLRQACCHPKMLMPSSKIKSSKLELFGETVLELLENGHKALVFSQFVKHLKLVEAWLKEQKISYQYLDGSTPLPKREKAINAFQGGEGDVFLISLKAGGTGLNLTAADYVIHLDPWWNPAVEDQASDRAHRIGQKRPVTIYRLVAEETIEEKIVKLHGEKRDLADSLLEGTEASAKLSANDLLNLIKGN